jgi:protein CpxP
MNSNRALRIWQITAILLVLCNVGLILVLWFKPAAKHDGPRHGGPRDFVIGKLKLNDDQIRQYDELIGEHQAAMRTLRDEAMQYRQQLFSHLRDGGSAVNKDSLGQLVANTQKQIEIVTYDHFAEVRKICNNDQKKEFDHIIADVIKKMNGGMRPPPPDDRHGPPEGEQSRP